MLNFRINKIRHKDSFRYFDTVTRTWIKKWKKERYDNTIIDIKYLILLYCATWIIIDSDSLLLVSNEIIYRLPKFHPSFINFELLKKYLPEVSNDVFLKNANLTKKSFAEIMKKPKFNEYEYYFKNSFIFVNELIINDKNQNKFTKNEIFIYEVMKKPEFKNFKAIFIYKKNKTAIIYKRNFESETTIKL